MKASSLSSPSSLSAAMTQLLSSPGPLAEELPDQVDDGLDGFHQLDNGLDFFGELADAVLKVASAHVGELLEQPKGLLQGLEVLAQSVDDGLGELVGQGVQRLFRHVAEVLLKVVHGLF